MPSIIQKRERAERRALRTSNKLMGSATRPRLAVFRSLRGISVQLIDDTKSVTLAAANDKEIKGMANKTQKAIEVGKLIAKKAAEKKINEVIFDRRSYQYHGRVKALADAAREAGLKF